MKRHFLFLSLLIFSLTLSAKNISDYEAQKNVDKVISEQNSKLQEDRDGGSMLLSSDINLSHLLTWKDVYDEISIIMYKTFNELLIQNDPNNELNINVLKKNFTKDDMLLNFILLDDIKTTAQEISNIVNKLNNSVCYNSNYSYSENNINYQNSKTGKYFCDNNTNYIQLLKILKNLSQIGNEIYKYSYEYEKNKFVKQNKLDISQTYALVETLFNYMNIVPNKNSIYHLENIKALQNTKNGVLVKGSEIFSGEIHPDKVAMIYTKKKFVTNENMYPYGKVKFVGTYDYVSTLGINQTVYAYKFVDVNKLVNNFYFYPQLKQELPANAQYLAFDLFMEMNIAGKKVSFDKLFKAIDNIKK